MFSVSQKREISAGVQRLLRQTNHPELPLGEISFELRVGGAESWSWAHIKNNGAVTEPGINPWNELQDAAKCQPLNEAIARILRIENGESPRSV